MIDTVMSNSQLGLQEQLIALIRAFGLHRPDQTPCGKPVAVAEAHALMELIQGVPLSQNDLAARLHLEKSTVSRLVGIMESRGWIARARSAQDGRARELFLTDIGRQMAAELAEARRAKFARVFEAIPEAERAVVFESLQMLVEAMRANH
ncbi:MAG: MarR family winged helix-turn-helix transcriptional regulator [Chloroflexota bacterium]|nr:MarR family winged helix-turn-helix transcriptional regulator [Chloroflexota bacterium]